MAVAIKRRLVDVHCKSMTCKGSYIVSANEGAEVICGRCGRAYRITQGSALSLQEQVKAKRKRTSR